MSKWIDAEYCEDFFDRWESRVKNAEPVTIDVVQNTRTLLRDAPSIDIVFCKECKHAHMTYGGDCKYCDMWKDDDDFCIELYLDGDFYCAYGERKGE